MGQILPPLDYKKAKPAYETLHLFTQVLGKIKLKLLPWTNHSWHVTLTVTPKGLSTGALCCNDKNFELLLDLQQHQLVMILQNEKDRHFPLEKISVATFYKQLWQFFRDAGLQVQINMKPNEVMHPIPFDKDEAHHHYKQEPIEALHQALLFSHDTFTTFRSTFIGKCSPVQFFWGSFDLAVTRFSGKKAPEHPGGIPNLPDAVAKEAYSHEVISNGFWPGNDMLPLAAFYAYAYPEPDNFKTTSISPQQAYYHKDMGEYILTYEEVQKSKHPRQLVLEFFNSTYHAASALGGWDKEALEQQALANI